MADQKIVAGDIVQVKGSTSVASKWTVESIEGGSAICVRDDGEKIIRETLAVIILIRVDPGKSGF